MAEHSTFKEDRITAFPVGIEGEQMLVSRAGWVRLGGDGRDVVIGGCNAWVPKSDWWFTEHSRAFR